MKQKVAAHLGAPPSAACHPRAPPSAPCRAGAALPPVFPVRMRSSAILIAGNKEHTRCVLHVLIAIRGALGASRRGPRAGPESESYTQCEEVAPAHVLARTQSRSFVCCHLHETELNLMIPCPVDQVVLAQPGPQKQIWRNMSDSVEPSDQWGRPRRHQEVRWPP